jgi:hypothetical protein
MIRFSSGAAAVDRTDTYLPFVLGASAAAAAALSIVAPWTVGVAGGLLVFVLSAVESEPFLLAIVFLTPLDALLKPGSLVADVSISLHALVVVGFFAGRLLRGELNFRPLWQPALTRSSVLFVCAATLSVLLGSAAKIYTRASLRGVYFLAVYVGFYLVVLAWFNDKPLRVRKATTILLVSTAMVIIFGFVQELVGGYTALWDLLYPPANHQIQLWNGRPPSFLGYGNHLGAYLDLVLPFAFACWMMANETFWKRVGAWILGTGVVLLILAQSRGAFAAFGCVLILAIVHFCKTWPKRLLMMSGLAVFALLIYMVLLRLDTQHFSSFRDMNSWGRLLLWGVLVRLFLQSPIHGVGIGTFPSIYSYYIPASLGIGENLEAHNVYLELLGETGLVGLLSFGLLMYVAVRDAWRLLESRNWFDHSLGFGILGAALTALVYGFVDHALFWSPQIGTLFWFWLAVLAARRSDSQALGYGTMKQGTL